jgi:3-phosphoshikimate 1-carboxyvinyltransferase
MNVPQARLKETDRIAVMASELAKLGVDCTELPDGLAVKQSAVRGGALSGYGDHRIVMALAVAGMAGQEPVTVDTAEAVSVTFPEFNSLMCSLGARIEIPNL